MPFLSHPAFEKLSEVNGMGRATWRLVHPLSYFHPDGRRFLVPAGFKTDFASVPRLPLAYWFTGDSAHLSAVLHDWLCRTLYADGLMTWREAADVFRVAMAEEGVEAWRRWLMYWAVRLFGEAGQ